MKFNILLFIAFLLASVVEAKEIAEYDPVDRSVNAEQLECDDLFYAQTDETAGTSAAGTNWENARRVTTAQLTGCLLNVKQFGVAGDGTDEDVDIQAAFAAWSDNETLYFPEGEYDFGDVDVSGLDNVKLLCDRGARFVRDPGGSSSTLDITASTNVEIEGCTWDRGHSANTGTNQGAIRLYGVTNAWIHKNNFLDVNSGVQVELDGSTPSSNIHVYDNTGSAVNAMTLANVTNQTVPVVLVQSNGSASFDNDGIFVYDNSMQGFRLFLSTYTTRAIITSNTSHQSADSVIYFSNGTSQFVASDNVITEAGKDAIKAIDAGSTDGTVTGNYVKGVGYVATTGNVCFNYEDASNIVHSGNVCVYTENGQVDPENKGIVLSCVNNVIVSNEVIDGSLLSDDGGSDAITLSTQCANGTSINDVLIADIVVKDIDGYGVDVLADAASDEINRLTIEDMKIRLGGDNGEYCVRVRALNADAKVNDLTIRGNECSNYDARGISIEGTGADNTPYSNSIIEDNYIFDAFAVGRTAIDFEDYSCAGRCTVRLNRTDASMTSMFQFDGSSATAWIEEHNFHGATVYGTDYTTGGGSLPSNTAGQLFEGTGGTSATAVDKEEVYGDMLATQGIILASDYGVVCDGVTDVTTELQNAVNALQNSIATNEGGYVQLPLGQCVISDTIILTSTTDTDSFNNGAIRGVSAGTALDAYGTQIDHTAILDGPAFEITAARDFQVEYMTFSGPNTDPAALSEPSFTEADYETSGVRTNQFSPQCAISVDGLAGDPSGTSNDYPGLTHRASTSGSFSVRLKNLNIENSLVGICVSPNGESTQADDVEIVDVDINGVKYCTSWGQNQNRSAGITRGQCNDFYIGHTGLEHGDQNGGGIMLMDHQWINGLALFSFPSTSESPLHLIQPQAEAFHMIGRYGSGSGGLATPLLITGGRFNSGGPAWTELPPPIFLEVHAPFVWKGSFFKHGGAELMATSGADPYEYVINVYGTQGQGLIDTVSFRAGIDGENFPFIARSRDLNEMRIGFDNSYIIAEDNSRDLMSDRYYNSQTLDDRVKLTSNASIFQTDGLVYTAELGDTAEYEAITMDAASWNVNTVNKDLEFSVDQSGGDEPGVIQVGDIINFQVSSPIGGQANVDLPACRVTSVTDDVGNTEDDIVCEMLWHEDTYNSGYAPSAVKVQRNFFAVEPGVTLECDLTNASPNLSGCTNESILEVGDWLDWNGITGISGNTRVTAIGSGTVTLNKNATTTAADTNLYDSQLIPNDSGGGGLPSNTAGQLIVGAGGTSGTAVDKAEVYGDMLLGTEIYLVTDAAYGAVGDGSNVDNGPLFQLAMDACETNGSKGVVVVPPGDYEFDTGFTYKCPIRGIDGSAYPNILVSDSMPRLRADAGSDVANGVEPLMTIDSGLTSFDISGLQFEGILANGLGVAVDADASTFSRWSIRDVYARGWDTAFDIDGFIGLIENVHTGSISDTAFILSTANGVTFIGGEICQGNDTGTGATCVRIETGSGIYFFGSVIENTGTGSIGLDIRETVSNVVFEGYFEATEVPIRAGFGGTGNIEDAVEGLRANTTWGTMEVQLDNVLGADFSTPQAATPNQLFFTTTCNTIDLQLPRWSRPDATGGYGPRVFRPECGIGEGLSVENAKNIFPDPNNRGNVDSTNTGLFTAITETNVDITQETAITRDGVSAYKIEKINSSGFDRAIFELPRQDWLAANAAGETMWVCAWYHYDNDDPDNSVYFDDTHKPQLKIRYEDDAVAVSVGITGRPSETFMQDQWSRLCYYEEIVNDGSTLSNFAVEINPTASGQATAEGATLIVSDIQVGFGKSAMYAATNGKIINDPEWPTWENAVIYGDMLDSLVDISDGTKYYFDEVSGSDGNDGLTEGTAKQSLTEASTIQYQAGDQLLFNRGDVWEGQGYLDISPDSTGCNFTPTRPLIISAYEDDVDEGNDNNRPVFKRSLPQGAETWSLVAGSPGSEQIWEIDVEAIADTVSEDILHSKGVIDGEDFVPTFSVSAGDIYTKLTTDRTAGFQSGTNDILYYRKDSGQPTGTELGIYPYSINIECPNVIVSGIDFYGPPGRINTGGDDREAGEHVYFSEDAHNGVLKHSSCKYGRNPCVASGYFTTNVGPTAPDNITVFDVTADQMNSTAYYIRGSGRVINTTTTNSGNQPGSSGDRGSVGLQGGHIIVCGHHAKATGDPDNDNDFAIHAFAPDAPVWLINNYGEDIPSGIFAITGINHATQATYGQSFGHQIIGNIGNGFATTNDPGGFSFGKNSCVRLENIFGARVEGNICANGGDAGAGRGVAMGGNYIGNIAVKHNIFIDIFDADTQVEGAADSANIDISDNISDDTYDYPLGGLTDDPDFVLSQKRAACLPFLDSFRVEDYFQREPNAFWP